MPHTISAGASFALIDKLRHNEVIWLLKATSPRITVDKVPEKAMVHRCLLIPELFGSVCEFLRHDYKMWRPLQWSATLASLARTCRAFEGPALGVLWRDIEGLRPLLCTMPSDLFELKAKDWSRQVNILVRL